MRVGFAFVHYEDRRDADDAIHYLNDEKLLGERLQVQPANGGGRGGGGGSRGSSSRDDRDRDSGTDTCFNCGKTGHWYLYSKYSLK